MISDTIVAVGTALGEGAIGIVRLSGPEAFSILDAIFDKVLKNEDEDKKMYYGKIKDAEKVIDEVMAVKMKGPLTYTREDIVEIYCHGGLVPIRAILNLALMKGARVAERGEFTQRAFVNGRIDLAQAESIMDLISAKTSLGFDVAMQQLEGRLSLKIKEARNLLMALMAEVEVCIDYPEEDIQEITYPQIIEKLTHVEGVLLKLSHSSKAGKIIREGIKAVIVGKPNVGKSSLMNALLGEQRAIVTEIAGTTRDVIEERITIKGVPLRLIDTAGIRDTEDVVEKIGVEKSKQHFNEADLVIFVLNGAEPLSEEDMQIMHLVKDKHALVIINKSDLPQAIDEAFIERELNDKRIIKVSILQDTGIDGIEPLIADLVLDQDIADGNADWVTNTRHAALIDRSLKNVQDALSATMQGMPYDFIEVDVKEAILNLGHITGESVEADLMKNIFGNFCLGK